MADKLQVNGQRLWTSLMDMAQIGATDKGGCRRLTLSDEDKRGRDLFVEWCQAANCKIDVDSMGNIFARRAGVDGSRLPVATGSHLDTQPHGGKFDGVFGVLAGLEVVRTLNDHNLNTSAPLEVVSWTNEEGVRFAPSMLASGVFAGVFEPNYARDRTDIDGLTFGAELDRIGYAGNSTCGDHPLAAFLEAHIEQGPVLENTKNTIGVVTGVQGFRWYDVRVEGQDAHSGSTPMVGRRDALLGSARLTEVVHRTALSHAPDGRGTVGQLQVFPNSRNTIPGRVEFTIDIRHPDPDVLVDMDQTLQDECRRIAAETGLDIDLEQVSYSPPVNFNQICVSAVHEAAKSMGYTHRLMTSGAGHDACYISLVAPTSMIFVPCAGGISHNEAESATFDDIVAGCNVLLHALLSLAQ